nr:MAG: ORF1 [Torque teno midi virus]
MAWYFRRKRAPWYRRRWKRRRYTRKRRRFPRRRVRRRPYKTTRRYRKKRKQRRVRKHKKLPLIQWQPESTRKCNIIGYAPLIIGCTGRQQNNYIFWQDYWTHPKCPAGGSFAVYKFSLGLLYEDYKRHRNVWTKSNCDYDLCKYVKTKLYFFPHPEVDFVIHYTRSYPMIVDENTYMSTHPFYLMLRKHKLVIPSKRTNPHGKQVYKLTLKPPRQSINKWYFQKPFSDIGLFMIQAAALDLTYSYLGPNSRNRLVTLQALNPQFWGSPQWGAKTTTTYSFKIDISAGKGKVAQYNDKGTLKNYTIPNDFNSNNIHAWEKGIFNYKFLNIQIWPTEIGNKQLPLIQVQYNPMVDIGKGNVVYFISTLQTSWSPPTTDRLLVWRDRPLWLLMFGLQDYILKAKNTTSALQGYICVIQSKAIFPVHDQIVVIGNNFLSGLTECGVQPLNPVAIDNWYLDLEDQNPAINEIVKSGPFVPRMDGFRCSWELNMKYHSKWIWGGATPPLKPACDPYQQEVFPVPDTIKQALQIIDPKKQIPESLLHSWDYRRGFITKAALKRMQKNLSDAELSSTDSEPPIKKRKADPPCYQEKEESLLSTVQTLCQEEETNQNRELQQYQQQQHQKQLQLLKLISELKRRQLHLQLMTGLME